MKTVCILLLLVAVANAFTIEALKEELLRELERSESPESITLREYLDSLDTPDPVYKLSAKRSIASRVLSCAATCGKLPTLNQDQTCTSGKWRPKYDLVNACECLVAYKCCDESCPPADVTSCWKTPASDWDNKGLLYGVEEVDCCGCTVVKCLPCIPPPPKDEVCPSGDDAKDPGCYGYTEQHKFNDSPDKCFEAHCEELRSDADEDEECNDRCQDSVTKYSPCKFPFQVCTIRKTVIDCPRTNKQLTIETLDLGLDCYTEPVKFTERMDGEYYDPELAACTRCYSWTYTPKGCASQDQANSLVDCHLYGANELDRRCFKKENTQDNCGCNIADCIANPEIEGNVFGANEVCPKDHRKISGVSICMKARDVCKPCSPPIKIDASDCPIGRIELTTDCNGCPKYVCQAPAFFKCPNDCKKYVWDPETNLLSCGCPIFVG